jgi:hypothetical protein
MPRSPTKLFESRSAVVVAALYLLVAVLTLALPILTRSNLAGVWTILLTLPWSAIFPMDVVSETAPGLAGAARLLFLFGAMVLNAALLYVGVRWAGRWSASHRP